MKKLNFNTRVFLHQKTSAIQVRVRWNHKKNQVVFSTGLFADPEKWNQEKQGPKGKATHVINGHTTTAVEITNTIRDSLTAVESVFDEFSLKGISPSPIQFKNTLDTLLGKAVANEENEITKKERTSLEAAFKEFMKVRPTEVLWAENSHHKYNQMYTHLKACDENVELGTINKKFLNKLKNYFINNGYHNATIAKHFRNVRGFLNWSRANGYSVLDEALAYKANIQVQQKRVIFLYFKELISFSQFVFPETKKHLDRARDYFCFMAFTSLRYSDLKNLKKTDVKEDCLEIYTEKTDDMLTIPLISYAKPILEKYKNNPGEFVFDVPSNQKLNDYIKDAAELAGLDRPVTEVYYCGKTKHETVNKLYDTLSCHDARRTFVCCSLAFGIPPTIVMKSTGHSDYKTMKPYIEVADETAKKEMVKWDSYSKKTEIISLLDKASEEQMQKVLKVLKA